MAHEIFLKAVRELEPGEVVLVDDEALRVEQILNMPGIGLVKIVFENEKGETYMTPDALVARVFEL